jgi:hypothetical protein
MTQFSPIDAPIRSIDEAIADLSARLKTLPLTDPRRGRMAQQLVMLEDERERRIVR